MTLQLKGLKIMVRMSVIMSLTSWQMMQQDCWPVKEVLDDLNRIVFTANIVDSHLILPNDHSSLVLFTRGSFKYIFAR